MVEKFTSYREGIVTEIGNNGFSLIKKINNNKMLYNMYS
jgi:hypothetical protein